MIYKEFFTIISTLYKAQEPLSVEGYRIRITFYGEKVRKIIDLKMVSLKCDK